MRANLTKEEFFRRYTFTSNDLLGKGSFGAVYKAYDNILNIYVAIKISAILPNNEALRLKNEVEKVAHLLHPNIAHYENCYTFNDATGNYDFAIMQYYECGSLDRVLSSNNLTLNERYDILSQILSGIKYLHENGVIHRDLKPQNILLVQHDGHYIPKISDFGISKRIDTTHFSTVNNSILGGTRLYASPEQLTESAIKKNSDLWSFGIIAYLALINELPFNSGSSSIQSAGGQQELFSQMQLGHLPKIGSVSEPWQTIIKQCLIFDNSKRVQSVEQCESILQHGVPSNNRHNNKIWRFLVLLFSCIIIISSAIYAILLLSSNGGDQQILSPQELARIDSLNRIRNDSIRNRAVQDSIARADSMAQAHEQRMDLLVSLGLGRDGVYKVGDYYNRGMYEGVVISVSQGGVHGVIIGLHQADFHTWDQARNWCHSHGGSWRLPTANELMLIAQSRVAIESTLRAFGGTSFGDYLYWSSTVDDTNKTLIGSIEYGLTYIEPKHNLNSTIVACSF